MSRHASPTLLAFVTTAETGSFAAAGRMLGLSAAAVGQNVRRLEDSYGVTLFTRTTRKMSLTPEGLLLLERARGPLRELDELDHILAESEGQASGTLRLTAPRFFAEEHLLPMVTEFCRLHPRVNIDIDSSDAVRDFVDDPVDVAFRIGTPEDSSMIARHLSDLSLLTVASPDWVAANGTLDHPDQVMDYDCIRYRFPSSGRMWMWRYQVDGDVKFYDPPSRLTLNDPELLMKACISGLGLLQMDAMFAADHLAAGRLVTLLEGFGAANFELYLAYPQRRNLPFRTRAFVDFVMRTFKRDRFKLAN
ncbi:MAG: LysR family transcriptional regulator [Pseudomonadota bacterium]